VNTLLASVDFTNSLEMVVYEVYGDSNISRCWKAVVSDCEKLKGSVLRSITTLLLLKDSLRTVSQTTRFVLLSALSNPVSKLVHDGTEPTIRVELNRLFEDIQDALTQTVNCNPELRVRIFMCLRSLA